MLLNVQSVNVASDPSRCIMEPSQAHNSSSASFSSRSFCTKEVGGADSVVGDAFVGVSEGLFSVFEIAAAPSMCVAVVVPSEIEKDVLVMEAGHRRYIHCPLLSEDVRSVNSELDIERLSPEDVLRKVVWSV